MRLGDMDGLRSIYDREGKPILAEGESLVAERKAEAFALFRGKRPKGDPLIHQGRSCST